MSLASFEDANNHLDKNKVMFQNDSDARDIATATDRYIRGCLTDVYGADVVTLWDVDPTAPQTNTPELIREVTGMLMASKLYAEKYAEETQSNNTYGYRLQKEAEGLLDQLRAGTLTLVEVDVVSGISFGEDDFWPNDTTAAQSTAPQPKFTMDDVF